MLARGLRRPIRGMNMRHSLRQSLLSQKECKFEQVLKTFRVFSNRHNLLSSFIALVSVTTTWLNLLIMSAKQLFTEYTNTKKYSSPKPTRKQKRQLNNKKGRKFQIRLN
jgi:hypothetical protein